MEQKDNKQQKQMPLSIAIEQTKQQIAQVIAQSNLPAYLITLIISDLSQELNRQKAFELSKDAESMNPGATTSEEPKNENE